MNGRTMARTPARRTHRKVKKSFTLSAESVKFLDALRKKHRAFSVSSVLEDLVQAAHEAQAKEALDRAVTQYYDSLSPEEVQEQADWGEFAMRQFSSEDA